MWLPCRPFQRSPECPMNKLPCDLLRLRLVVRWTTSLPCIPPTLQPAALPPSALHLLFADKCPHLDPALASASRGSQGCDGDLILSHGFFFHICFRHVLSPELTCIMATVNFWTVSFGFYAYLG